MTERENVSRIPAYPESLIQLLPLSPEEKSDVLKGNWELVSDFLDWWERVQVDLREGSDGEKKTMWKYLLMKELRELKELEELEKELREGVVKGFVWYEDERALDRWKVASEMADVVIFVYALLYAEGFSKEGIRAIFKGEEQHELAGMIRVLRTRARWIGVDLAEAIIYKTEQNIQHRDPALWPEWRENGFMKTMRRNIGDDTTEIPHLAQGPLGVTILTRLQVVEFDDRERRIQSGFPVLIRINGHYASLNQILNEIVRLRNDPFNWLWLDAIVAGSEFESVELALIDAFSRGDGTRLIYLLGLLGFGSVEIEVNELNGFSHNTDSLPWASLQRSRV